MRAECSRNGFSTGKVRVPSARVAGASEIVSWRYGRAISANAAKVWSRPTKSCAAVSPTGATSDASGGQAAEEAAEVGLR